MSRIGLQLGIAALDAIAAAGGKVDQGLVASLVAGLSPLVDREPSDAEASAITLLTIQLIRRDEEETSAASPGAAEEPVAGEPRASSPSGPAEPATGDTSSPAGESEEAEQVPPGSATADPQPAGETPSEPAPGPEQAEEPTGAAASVEGTPTPATDSSELPVS